MNLKSESDTTVLGENLDKVLPNGMTRRQVLEKVLQDNTPGLRGEAKWEALRKAKDAHQTPEQPE